MIWPNLGFYNGISDLSDHTSKSILFIQFNMHKMESIMAKMYTDTTKWDEESFQNLSPKMKLVKLYLWDKCDHAGIWKINLGLMSYQIGTKVTLEEILEHLGDDLERRENFILIKSFFEFQNGTKSFNLNNNCHKSAKNLLDKFQGLASPSPTPDQGLCNVMYCNSNGNSNGNVKEEFVKNKLPELAKIWNKHCGPLAKVIGTTPERDRKSKERLREAKAEEWVRVIEKIVESDFCTGKGNTGWKADFDWLTKPGTRLKVLEGKYDNKKGQTLNWDWFLKDEDGKI